MSNQIMEHRSFITDQFITAGNTFFHTSSQIRLYLRISHITVNIIIWTYNIITEHQSFITILL